MAARTEKLILIVLMNIVLAAVAPAQQSWYYPLATGNEWTYGEELLPGQWAVTAHRRIVGDSVMSNGLRYAAWDDYRYQRQAGLQVWNYHPWDSTEALRYDFSLKNGDTMQVLYIPASENREADTITTIAYTAEQRVFGVMRQTMSFFTSGATSIGGGWVTVADSLGEVSYGGEPGYRYYVLTAVIDGKLYGTVDVGGNPSRQVPTVASLAQNYPNPFNPATTIHYALPERSFVRLVVFNTLGQEVARLVDGIVEAGDHDVVFDGARLASGVYYYRLTAGAHKESHTMLLIR